MAKNYCTTYKQAEHLKELGLSSRTADMHFLIDIDKKRWTICDGFAEKHMYEKSKYYDYKPCWSICALLELLPYSFFGGDGKIYSIHIGYKGRNPNIECVANMDDKTMYPDGYTLIYRPDKCKTWFDYAYAMVCWLLDNEYIKA